MLEQIRKRLERAKARVWTDPFYVGTSVYVTDVEELLGEVDRLTIERDAIKTACDGLCISHDNVSKQLTSTQKQLRAAAEQIVRFGRTISYLNNRYNVGLDNNEIQKIMDKWRGVKEQTNGTP